MSSSSPQLAHANSNVFTTHLSGREVVPAVQTQATGEAKLTLSSDGATLAYRINVANLENAVQASLHLGPPGQNGEVIALLYGPAPSGEGRTTGLLTAGTITQATLLGSLLGHPVSDLIAAIRSRNVYVEVATNGGPGITTQKAGNMPDGEIRGQIR
jgi:hypothetical protein